MRDVPKYEADEIKHQVGNSLTIIGGRYARYCNHPEFVKRNIFRMLIETKKMAKKLEEIYRNEEIL